MAMQVLLIGARAALYYCSPFTGKLDNFFKTRRRGESDASARYSAVLPNDTTEQHRAEGDGGSESSVDRDEYGNNSKRYTLPVGTARFRDFRSRPLTTLDFYFRGSF